MDEILNSQAVNSKTQPKSLINQDGVWKTKHESVRIPEDDEKLLLRIFVIVHYSSAGHRGLTATEAAVRRNFW